MCGVVGLIGGGSASTAREMIDTLAHRGPDGVRVETVETDRVKGALAHARLSIIDLEGGWQPLHAAGCTVIGNGEIYNYKELAEEFGLKDKLKTGSDFEPLLHLYAQQGEKAFDKLRGMYAFCLIGHDGRVWLVRDPFGIKPLYWRQAEGMLQFASEPRALLREMKAVQVEPEPIQELLAFNYSLGRNTVFRGVRRLKPGEVVEVIYGRPAPKRVRSPLQKPDPIPRDEAGLLAALDRVLEDSVTVHQRSDVPYGLFLSGGIDSAVIAAMMARLNERPVTAFTCGFEAASGKTGVRDERAAAEKVARALNLDWREVTFGEEDFWRVLPQVAWALDEPTTDYAALPTYKLAEAAKGVLKVVLTGEGGDELFAGYGRYRRALRPTLFGGREAGPRPTSPFLADHGVRAVERWRQATDPRTALSPALGGLDRLQEAQARDIAGWLPADLLLKLDRCLMAHGLEGRTPFLDPEVARFAFFLPERFKVRGRMGKWILRRWLQRHCPGADPFGRKAGFTTPVETWIAPSAAQLGPRVAEVEGVRRFCDAEAVKAVFRDERLAEHRWPLLFFAVWWGIHVDRLQPSEALARLT
ncbi:MAG: asparagine synthase (glutamine-hydrolyzing) [Caulobacteraceae bacterium]